MKTTVIRSLTLVVAAVALVGAVRSAAASAEIARETQRRIRIMVSPAVANDDVDLGKTKALEVAIIQESSWSFSDIDPQTVEFAGAIPATSSTKSKDYDNDGLADRVYQFTPKQLKLTEADTMACLKLETINKLKMSGCTKVKVIKAKVPDARY
jgi:hypothetical protein